MLQSDSGEAMSRTMQSSSISADPSVAAHGGRRILDSDFYNRPPLIVAEELLGKYLVRRIGGADIAVPILETEAYDGPNDLACHGRFGCTQRTAPLFGPPGHWYLYLIYGMYWMLNVVTSREGYPAAVLIRTAGEWDGPGKLTKALQIDKQFNAKPIDEKVDLWIEDRNALVDPSAIVRTPRIGIEYAGEWAAKPYRFVVQKPKSAKD